MSVFQNTKNDLGTLIFFYKTKLILILKARNSTTELTLMSRDSDDYGLEKVETYFFIQITAAMMQVKLLYPIVVNFNIKLLQYTLLISWITVINCAINHANDFDICFENSFKWFRKSLQVFQHKIDEIIFEFLEAIFFFLNESLCS